MERWGTLNYYESTAMDSEPLKQLFLVDARVRIGRLTTNQIVVSFPFVSGTHCEIFTRFEQTTAGGVVRVFVTDKSTNGTLVNGALVGKNKTKELFDKDVVVLSKKGSKPGNGKKPVIQILLDDVPDEVAKKKQRPDGATVAGTPSQHDERTPSSNSVDVLLLERLRSKVQKLRKENATLEARHRDDVSKLLSSHSADTEQLREEMERTVKDQEMEIKSLKTQLTAHVNKLKVKANVMTDVKKEMGNLKSMYESESELYKSKQEECDALRESVKKLEEAKGELHRKFTDERRESDMMRIKISTLEELSKESAKLVKDAEERNAEMKSKCAELDLQLKQEKCRAEIAESSRASASEDLQALKQLLEETKDSVAKKDMLVHTLQRSNTAMVSQVEALEQKVPDLTNEVERLGTALEDSTNELDLLKQKQRSWSNANESRKSCTDDLKHELASVCAQLKLKDQQIEDLEGDLEITAEKHRLERESMKKLVEVCQMIQAPLKAVRNVFPDVVPALRNGSHHSTPTARALLGLRDDSAMEHSATQSATKGHYDSDAEGATQVTLSQNQTTPTSVLASQSRAKASRSRKRKLVNETTPTQGGERENDVVNAGAQFELTTSTRIVLTEEQQQQSAAATSIMTSTSSDEGENEPTDEAIPPFKRSKSNNELATQVAEGETQAPEMAEGDDTQAPEAETEAPEDDTQAGGIQAPTREQRQRPTRPDMASPATLECPPTLTGDLTRTESVKSSGITALMSPQYNSQDESIAGNELTKSLTVPSTDDGERQQNTDMGTSTRDSALQYPDQENVGVNTTSFEEDVPEKSSQVSVAEGIASQCSAIGSF